MTDSAVVSAFEHLVRHQSEEEVVPFLLQLDKADLISIRLKTKQLYREVNEWDSDKPNLPNDKEPLVFLAGIATYSRQEAMGRDFLLPWNFGKGAKGGPARWKLLTTVLHHSRPSWLDDWLANNTRNNPGSTADYDQLREMADAGLVAHEPWLFAQVLARYLHSFEVGRRKNFEEYVLKQFRADATMLQRDVPLLFDFDTPVDSAYIYDNGPNDNITWLTLLPKLAASGDLERGDLLTRSLLALRRDFRRPLLTWFKNLVLALQPTLAERLARQNELLELLAHPLPLVVNFALDQCKDLWPQPDFQASTLLAYAENLMTRQDLKTALRTLLAAGEKRLKQEPALAPALAQLATSALANADADVQQRAATLLATLLNPSKPLLTPEQSAQTSEAMASYADLLGTSARAALGPLLAAPPAGSQTPPVTYVPQEEFVPDISPATAIAPVADWHELLFLTGAVLKRDNPAATERWLDGLLRLRTQFPDNYAQQLRPYLQQEFAWALKGETDAEAHKIVMQYSFDDRYNNRGELVQALLMSWFTGFVQAKVPQVTFTHGSGYCTPEPTLLAERARLIATEAQLQTARPLPLLSTPTHEPYWVAPTTLVHKLLAYQAAGTEPNPADLTLALARTACTHPAEAAAAQALLPQLQHEGLRELLAWFLAPTASPAALPTLAAPATATAPTELPASLAEALPWLWAVAARTRHPTAPLPALLALADYPGLATAWQPGWSFEQATSSYQPDGSEEPPEVTNTWQELRVPTEHEGQLPPSPLLLYSLHARLLQTDAQYQWSLEADLAFLQTLLPNNPIPLYWHLLRTICPTTDQGLENRGIMLEFLPSLLGPGPTFEASASLLLAMGLAHNAAGCRELALAVLLAAVPTGRLVPAALGQALGQLLAAGFVPVQRLADNLAQARAIDAPTDDALRQTLDALLPELPAEPLRNARKLLEAYADLLARTQQPAPEPVQARLRLWLAAPSLKKIATTLLN